jgi:hypothetical protein
VVDLGCQLVASACDLVNPGAAVPVPAQDGGSCPSPVAG